MTESGPPSQMSPWRLQVNRQLLRLEVAYKDLGAACNNRSGGGQVQRPGRALAVVAPGWRDKWSGACSSCCTHGGYECAASAGGTVGSGSRMMSGSRAGVTTAGRERGETMSHNDGYIALEIA